MLTTKTEPRILPDESKPEQKEWEIEPESFRAELRIFRMPEERIERLEELGKVKEKF